MGCKRQQHSPAPRQEERLPIKLKFLDAGHVHLAAEAQVGCNSAGSPPQNDSFVQAVSNGRLHCSITVTPNAVAPACASAGHPRFHHLGTNE